MARSTPTVLVDRSGTIATGATAQDVAAAFTSRQYFVFQNISDTDMWVNFGTTAVADSPSFFVANSGGSIEFGAHTGVCPNGRVSVMCATTGKKFTAKEA